MVPPMLLTLWELPDLPPLLFQLLLEVVLELANMLPTQLELFTLPSVKLKAEPEAKADAGLLYGGYGTTHPESGGSQGQDKTLTSSMEHSAG